MRPILINQMMGIQKKIPQIIPFGAVVGRVGGQDVHVFEEVEQDGARELQEMERRAGRGVQLWDVLREEGGERGGDLVGDGRLVWRVGRGNRLGVEEEGRGGTL